MYETYEPCFCLLWISHVKKVKSNHIYETFEHCFLSPLNFHCERSEIRANLWNFWALLSVSFGFPMWTKWNKIKFMLSVSFVFPLSKKWNQSKFIKLLSLALRLLWVSIVKEVKSEQIYETFEHCSLSPLDFHWQCERSDIRTNLWNFWVLLSVSFGFSLWKKWN